MKLSKKLFTAGIVAALTLSVAASALAAELTVKTKKINEGQVKIATPFLRIFRMHIIKERQILDVELDISMHMIIRIIM